MREQNALYKCGWVVKNWSGGWKCFRAIVRLLIKSAWRKWVSLTSVYLYVHTCRNNKLLCIEIIYIMCRNNKLLSDYCVICINTVTIRMCTVVLFKVSGMTYSGKIMIVTS